MYALIYQGNIQLAYIVIRARGFKDNFYRVYITRNDFIERRCILRRFRPEVSFCKEFEPGHHLFVAVDADVSGVPEKTEAGLIAVEAERSLPGLHLVENDDLSLYHVKGSERV